MVRRRSVYETAARSCEFAVERERESEIHDAENALKREKETDQAIGFDAEQMKIDRHESEAHEHHPGAPREVGNDIGTDGRHTLHAACTVRDEALRETVAPCFSSQA